MSEEPLPIVAIDGKLGYSNPPLWKLVRNRNAGLALVPRRGVLAGAIIIWSTIILLTIWLGWYFDELIVAILGGVIFSVVMCLYVLTVLLEHAKGAYLELDLDSVKIPRRKLELHRSNIRGFELISGRNRPASPTFIELNLLYFNSEGEVVRVPVVGDLSRGTLARVAAELCEFADLTLYDRRLV